MFAAVWQLVVAAAGERGVLIALEDLHAADVATILLAHYLARGAHQVRALVMLELYPDVVDGLKRKAAYLPG
jgi:hypothetical protein